MQAVGAHHPRLDPLDQRPEHGDRLAAPVDQRRAWNVGAVAGQDFALAVQGQVIVVLGDEDVGKQARAGQAARDRSRWCRRLHDPLALPTGLLEPRGLDHLQLRGDEFKDLRHVLVHQAQRAAAVRAAFAWVEHDALARRRCGDPRLATPARRGAFGGRRGLRWCGLGLRRGHRHLEIFERELQLVDLPLDLFGTRPELLPLELGDADLERLDQRLVGPHRRRHPLGLRPLCKDDCLERGGVIRQGVQRRDHGLIVARNDPDAQLYRFDSANESDNSRGR